MGKPIAVMTSMTGTGDTVIGPGSTKVLCNNMPVVTMGASVTGAACVGTATLNPSTKVIIDGKPALTLTSQAMGNNPATGVPVTTPIAQTSATTKLA